MKTIRFLKRKEIDENKWNALIDRSSNSLPYALTWYLDIVSENWDALVVGDYDVVLPLVWLRKLGVKCLYQPFFCQQLGFFSAKALDKKIAAESLKLVKNKFAYLDMNLNPSAEIVANDFSLSKKKNLLLALGKEYVQLKKEFSDNHKRSISKAAKSNLQLADGEASAFMEFYTTQIVQRQPSFKAKHAKIFEELVRAVHKNKLGRTLTVKNAKNEIVSASLLIECQHRLINLAQATSPAGRSTSAAHFLFDQLIQEYSGSNYVLDFEGSSIPSIARFYEGFGAVPEVYFNFRTHLLKSVK